MQEEDIGATPPHTPPPPTTRPPALDLDDFSIRTPQQQAIIAPESNISFVSDRETTFAQQSQGAVVTTDSDPIPPGPVGWVMKITKIKRVKQARIAGGIFIGTLVALAIFIVAREYFTSFVTIPIPKTIPLVKDIPVIE